ncbi:alpha/beta hydrolase [Dactylosporangium sp. AC04546]|uniref:alpha/beta fold hydrolase n=1 Tax=Dactylosporangium sp. AC04546 TaxID=2862460 RepID=UPI001EDC93F8|nr:alpha/beta hydrolase [Dactylosporangium sp. AC04546]WVK86846.1 alpha/beta hydrolase [Dactylosporangium sp. AC04546]
MNATAVTPGGGHPLGDPASVVVDGADVHYWQRGDRGPELVLVHGASANAMWWHGVVPSLASSCRVTTVDLSGHGRSGHRTSYGTDQWVRDVIGVVDHALDGHPVYVGHSLGGRLGLRYAELRPRTMRGLVLIESLLRPASQLAPYAPPVPQSPRFESSAERLMTRFRLMPEHEPLDAAAMTPVVHYAMQQTPNGWRWRYDPIAVASYDDPGVDLAASRVSVRTAFGWGSNSALVRGEVLDHALNVLRVEVSQEIEGGMHHVVISHPDDTAEFILRCVEMFSQPRRWRFR